MTNTVSATNASYSLTGTQSNGSQTNPTDSLFQETLNGLQQTLQNFETAWGDTAISVKDATVGTASPVLNSQSSAPSLTVSGDLTETKIVNGKTVTQVDSFVYTQFQNSPPGLLGPVSIGFNIPVHQTSNRGSNEQRSTSSSGIGEVNALVTKYFSAIEGTISENGKNVSLLLAEINPSGNVKSG
jgi:hypothetical protein